MKQLGICRDCEWGLWCKVAESISVETMLDMACLSRNKTATAGLSCFVGSGMYFLAIVLLSIGMSHSLEPALIVRILAA